MHGACQQKEDKRDRDVSALGNPGRPDGLQTIHRIPDSKQDSRTRIAQGTGQRECETVVEALEPSLGKRTQIQRAVAHTLQHDNVLVIEVVDLLHANLSDGNVFDSGCFVTPFDFGGDALILRDDVRRVDSHQGPVAVGQEDVVLALP